MTRMGEVVKKTLQFFICRETKTNLSQLQLVFVPLRQIVFSRYFLFHYCMFIFHSSARKTAGRGDSIMRYMQFYYYLITGCFMIMLLYVLRLTSFFMCHVSAIKKALISSFTCPVAAFTHTWNAKCEMWIVLSVVCSCCFVCVSCVLWIRCAFVSLCLFYTFSTCMLCLEYVYVCPAAFEQWLLL